jgi:drug/metabolite transporter (DMT)-like permease
MDINAIISKLISESLLSLYPIFVQKINLPIDMQMWTRYITYIVISLFFINYAFVSKTILTYEGLGLSLINLIHIYSSYEGFKNLGSGESFAIFNIYPILILIFSGVLWRPVYFLALFGLFFFIYANYKETNRKDINKFWTYGFIMMLVSAITEAAMYFFVKKVKTDNSWNHVFIAYFFGAIFMTFYLFGTNNNLENLENKKTNLWLIGLALLINGVIGAIGYYLRFYSVYRLDATTYALLSFFGIIMAYIYGIFFGEEKFNLYKVLGTMFIIISNYLIL